MCVSRMCMRVYVRVPVNTWRLEECFPFCPCLTPSQQGPSLNLELGCYTAGRNDALISFQ